MNLNLRKVSAVLMGMVFFLTLLVFTVSAEQSTAIQLPIRITAEGALPKTAETYIVRITADSMGTPMPNNQFGGSFELEVNGLDETTFPTIYYAAVGEYTYKIEQIAGAYPDCKYDKRKYTMNVLVSNGADGGYYASAILHEDGKGAKPVDVEFHNEYKSAGNPSRPPKTGTDSHIFMWCVLLVTSGFGMLGTAILGKNEKKT